MARREVIEVTCDRCERTETQSAGTNIVTPEFKISLHGAEVVYTDLCKRCRGALEGYFKSATKTLDDKKEVEKKEVEKTPAPTNVESAKEKKKGFLGIG